MHIFRDVRRGGWRTMIYALTVAAAAGLTLPAFAQEKETVKIGSVALMSSAYTQQGVRGMDLAVKEINGAGGVWSGHPIELIKYDDQNKPEEAAAAAERLISRDKAKVILGSLTTTATAALSSVAKRRNAVLVGWSAKSEVLREGGTPLQFFLNSTVGQDTAQYSDFIVNNLKLKRVAIIAEQSDYGQSAINSITSLWKDDPNAPEIVAIERFDPRDTDFSPILTSIKGAMPDALYVAPGGAVETFANILKQRNQLAVPGIVLPAPGAMTGSLIGLAGEATEGLIFGDFYSNGSELPESTDFVQRFQKEYGYPPEKMELLGYEAVTVAAKGLENAGPDGGPREIGEAISQLEMDTARGRWRFDKLGQSYQAPAGFALLTVKDGKIINYKP
ncbi:ABC transporter substrate-binding protein [Oryzicola mucosus]|uniref:ABC transporter substrate-binding protein n=1 Tax=Oryzicola mucosus TaxID=2767425 RepID=A0A8J6PRA9_9HYPH|nr:ABC transporter substrate-binding protein [Oryzicola mucosus]MBD0416760.1 ABC transporter substrate-binding protein [Oryzicola mucosus]